MQFTPNWLNRLQGKLSKEGNLIDSSLKATVWISHHFWTLKLHFFVWIAQSIALNYVQNLLQKSVDIIFNPKTYLIKSTRSSKSSHSLQSTYYQQSLKRNLHKIVFNCKVLSCSSCHEKRIKEIKFLFLICHEKTPEASSP